MSDKFIDHLSLHCEVAIEVWNMVCQQFGVMWVMPGRLKECLESWRRQNGNRIVIQIWRIALLCVMWCLKRNKKISNYKKNTYSPNQPKKPTLTGTQPENPSPSRPPPPFQTEKRKPTQYKNHTRCKPSLTTQLQAPTSFITKKTHPHWKTHHPTGHHPHSKQKRENQPCLKEQTL
jgi:hypothetical protein